MRKKLMAMQVALVLGALASQGVVAGTALPSDPQSSECSIDRQAFDQWFEGGVAVPNGAVKFADGVIFPPLENTACDFYKWSEQMFLWLTSHSTAYAGGPGYVFDSPLFFDVSPESGGVRTLLSNAAVNGRPPTNRFGVRAMKDDEVVGEVAQAGSAGALISQGNSLVYYGVHVNDVFAYFLTGQKGGALSAREFPNSAADIDAVAGYVKSLGLPPLADLNAMTMELKTAWVDVTTVDDPGRFVTIDAVVPNYVPSTSEISPNREWVLDGEEPKRLALVGMHVVGSVNGHPEMVWATIEHIDNAPDNGYYYTNAAGGTTAVPYSSAGHWLFTQTDATMASGNKLRQKVDLEKGASTGNIVAVGSEGIGPSNTYRVNPWGSPPSQAYAGNNAQLISLNNDVRKLLGGGDVRGNYFLSGAVWTQKGNLPAYSTPAPAFTQKGSLNLANSTMETFTQDDNPTPPPSEATTGCFACHSVSGAAATAGEGLGVSHIYGAIQPLPVGGK